MRRRITTGLFAAAILACGAIGVVRFGADGGSEQPLPQSSAGLILDPEQRELGTLIPGETVPLTFAIRNDSRVRVTVSDLHTTCGCSPATISANAIDPQESAVITVELRPPHAGPVSHAVLFKTDFPGREDVQLPFAGRAVWPVICDPAVLSFGVLDLGGTATREFELTSTDRSPFRVLAATPSVPWLAIEMPAGDAKPGHRLRAVAKAVPGPGRAQADIEIRTDNPKQPLVQLPFVADVVAPLTASPPRLMLPPTKAGQVVTARIALSRRDGTLTELSSVVASDGNWQVVRWSLTDAPKAATRVVELELKVPAATGYQRTTLCLAPPTGDPMTVAVSAVVEE